MADNVNLRKDEYNKIAEDLEIHHKETLACVEGMTARLRELLTAGDGFYMRETNEVLLQVLDLIDHNLLQHMKQIFETTELSVEAMIDTVTHTDMAC